MVRSDRMNRRGDVLPNRYYRRLVLDDIKRQRGGSVAVILSMHGMGRSLIINQFVFDCMRAKKRIESADLTLCGYQEIVETLNDMVARCARHGSESVLAIKELPPIQDDLLEQVVVALDRAREIGVAVVVGTVPENELLIEAVDDVQAFWPCDLCIEGRVSDGDRDRFETYTHGIPSLVREFDKLRGAFARLPFTSVGYLEAYTSLIRDAMLRGGLTNEERLVVALMLMLGSGKRADIEGLTGEVLDSAIWYSLARCEPLLGINVVGAWFSVVGCGVRGAAEATIAAMAGTVELWGRFVPRIVAMLVERGSVTRAAAMSVACTDAYTRCRLALTNCMRFVNAGAVSVVRDAIATVEAEGYVGVPGYHEGCAVLSSLLYAWRYEGPEQRTRFYGSTIRGRYAEICLALREGLHGAFQEEVLVDRFDDDAMTRALLVHARVTYFILQGSLVAAHVLSVDSGVVVRTGTLLGTLIQLDRAFCLVMSGRTLAREDCKTLAVGRDLLEHAGLTKLVQTHDALILLARTLGSRACDYAKFPEVAQRAFLRGDTALGALYMVGAAVHDLRLRNTTHSLVRIRIACDHFADAGLTWWYACARVLELAMRTEAGSRVKEEELRACLGYAREIDAVVALLSCALRDADPTSLRSYDTLGYVDENVLWIINVLAHDLPKVSPKVRACLGSAWLQTMRDVELDSITEEGWTGPYAYLNRVSVFDEYVGQRPISIRALGGIDVRVCGHDVPSDLFARRKGLSLLALLVASEGHALEREEAKHSFEIDAMKDGKKNVMSAASVIRNEIKRAAGDESLGEALIANKTRGILSLHGGLIACDVDLFEECARRAKAEEERDLVVAVRACRDADELYCGDLYAPKEDDRMQLCENRRRGLRDLFVETLLSGSRAAVQLGRFVIAARFAERGHELAPANDDLLMVLVEALYKSGRRADARDRYFSFVDRTIENKQFVSEEVRRQVAPYVTEDTSVVREVLGSRLPNRSITVREEPVLAEVDEDLPLVVELEGE